MRVRQVQGRAAQLIVAYVLFVSIGSSSGPSPLYVIYQREWHLASVTLTAVFAVYAVGVLLALPIAGPLSDRRGRKPMLVVAVAVLLVSIVLLLLATDVVWLVVGRFLQGIATGTVTGAAAAAIVELDARADPRGASILTTATFLSGAACMPMITGLIAQYAPQPTVLPFAAELGLTAVAAALLPFVPEPRSRDAAATTASATSRRLRIERPRVPRTMRVPFFVAGATVSLAWAIGSLYAALSGSIESSLLHIESHAVTGFWLFVYNGLGGFGQVSMRRWTSRSALLIGVSGVTLGMGVVQGSAMLGSPWLFYVGTFLAGAGGGAAFMGAVAVINHYAPPAERAAVLSAFSVVSYLAVAIPVVGVGLLSVYTGLAVATGAFLGVSVIVAVPLLAFVARRLPPQAPVVLAPSASTPPRGTETPA